MGIIKRIIRQTSNKLLRKLGARSNSNRLVLNQSVGLANHRHALESNAARLHYQPSKKLRASRARAVAGGVALLANKRPRADRANKESAQVAEALLIAAKNQLPPVQFHHVHGPTAQLSMSRMVARRTQSFCHALVFSNRVILPNERVYIKVLEIAKGWSGTIRFGFTSLDPATLSCRMPKHVCPDMTNSGHTWARALADEVVRRNSVIHFSYNSMGHIHYGINNQDCGIFCANVNTTQNLWFIVDIYGLTAKVALIDPRSNNPTGHMDFVDSPLDPVSNRPVTGHRNLLKTSSVSMIDLEHHRSTKKKRSRKLVARQRAQEIFGDWSSSENVMTLSQLPLDQSAQASLLPNLNSLILPATQQNIYSPMPTNTATSVANRQATNTNEVHDYYQILNSNSTDWVEVNAERVRQQTRKSKIPSNRSATLNIATMPGNVSFPLVPTSSSALNNSNYSNPSGTRVAWTTADDQEICQKLTGVRISDDHQMSKSKLTRSTADISALLGGSRRKQQHQQTPVQTNSKIAPELSTQKDRPKLQTGLHPKPRSSNSSTASLKSKPRHSSPKSSLSRDNNDGSPGTKDCPICFERPINCVLYQCGHMCTCYECGVKQWKTQSRTCPICRTVIKDVIKTYMS